MISKKTLLNTFAVIFAVILAILIIIFRHRLNIVIAPLAAALIIIYLFTPIISWLEQRGMRRGHAIAFVYGFFMLFVIAIILFVLPEFIRSLNDLAKALPDIPGKLRMYISSSGLSEELKNVVLVEYDDIVARVTEAGRTAASNYMQYMMGFAYFFYTLVMGLVISYYIIHDFAYFRDSVLLFTPRKWRKQLVKLCADIDRIISNFVQGQIMIAIILSVIETAVLYMLHVKFALVLGLIGGILNVIPYFGPYMGALPAIAVSMIDSPAKGLAVTVLFVAAQQLDNFLITPAVIKSKMGLHPVITILAILIGGAFFGVSGMILALPVTAIGQVLVRQIVDSIV